MHSRGIDRGDEGGTPTAVASTEGMRGVRPQPWRRPRLARDPRAVPVHAAALDAEKLVRAHGSALAGGECGEQVKDVHQAGVRAGIARERQKALHARLLSCASVPACHGTRLVSCARPAAWLRGFAGRTGRRTASQKRDARSGWPRYRRARKRTRRSNCRGGATVASGVDVRPSGENARALTRASVRGRAASSSMDLSWERATK